MLMNAPLMKSSHQLSAHSISIQSMEMRNGYDHHQHMHVLLDADYQLSLHA
jgi:hypothetical protein